MSEGVTVASSANRIVTMAVSIYALSFYSLCFVAKTKIAVPNPSMANVADFTIDPSKKYCMDKTKSIGIQNMRNAYITRLVSFDSITHSLSVLVDTPK